MGFTLEGEGLGYRVRALGLAPPTQEDTGPTPKEDTGPTPMEHEEEMRLERWFAQGTLRSK